MKDNTPNIAIQSLGILEKYEILTYVSIVAWPTVPLTDIVDTIRYVDNFNVYAIRVSLPGYTNYFLQKTGFEGFNREKVWEEIVRAIVPLRKATEAPIIIIPYLFEEKIFNEGRLNEATVTGTVKNSTGAIAGLKPGDVIVDINNTPIVSRIHAKIMLSEVKENEKIVMVVRRDGNYFRIIIDTEKCKNLTKFPFTDLAFSKRWAHGIMLPSGFSMSYLDEIQQLIEKYDAKETLIITTELMYPTIKQAMKEYPFKESIVKNLHIEIAENCFWGGNIIMGDLLVVDDFITSVKKFIEQTNITPDLVIIPGSGFGATGGWKRDLRGVYYKYIERNLDVPVELVGMYPIMY